MSCGLENCLLFCCFSLRIVLYLHIDFCVFYGFRLDVFEGEYSGFEGYCGFDDCVFPCRLGLLYFSSAEYVGRFFCDDFHYLERLWA